MTDEPESASTSTTTTSTTTTKPSVTMTRERGNPKIEPKLAGQHNFAQWILSIEQTLEQYDHEEGSIWDIVTGVLKNPVAGLTAAQMEKSTDIGKKGIIWRWDNSFAILTMK